MYTFYNAVRWVDRVLLGGYERNDGDLETASCLCFGAVAGKRPGGVRASLSRSDSRKETGQRPGVSTQNGSGKETGQRPGVSV